MPHGPRLSRVLRADIVNTMKELKHPLLSVLTKSTCGIALAVIAASSFAQAEMDQFILPDNAAPASAAWLGAGTAVTLADTPAYVREQGHLWELQPDDNALMAIHYLKEKQ